MISIAIAAPLCGTDSDSGTVVVVVVVIVIGKAMQFGHEQLDVYRLAIDYVAWSYAVAKELNGVDRTPVINCFVPHNQSP